MSLHSYSLDSFLQRIFFSIPTPTSIPDYAVSVESQLFNVCVILSAPNRKKVLTADTNADRERRHNSAPYYEYLKYNALR
jgi:hypothetical protein